MPEPQADALEAARIIFRGSTESTTQEEVRAALELLFRHRPWNDVQADRGKNVTEAAINFAEIAFANVPPCSSRTRAIHMIEEARMLLNAAITHEGAF